MTDDDDPTGDEHLMAHAWHWFSLHSDQRMRLINFWLVSMAFLVAAYAQATTGGQNRVAVGVAIGGLLATACFHRLDVRTRDLVRVSEQALRVAEDRLATRSRCPQIALVELSHTGRQRWLSYRTTLRVLHASAGIGFLFAALGAIR